MSSRQITAEHGRAREITGDAGGSRACSARKEGCTMSCPTTSRAPAVSSCLRLYLAEGRAAALPAGGASECDGPQAARGAASSRCSSRRGRAQIPGRLTARPGRDRPEQPVPD